MPVIEAKTPEHFAELIKNDRCIIDFFATWCAPCKRLGEKLAEISEKLDDILIIKADINELDTVAQVYNVSVIPYIVFHKKRKPCDKIQSSNYLDIIEKAKKLYESVDTESEECVNTK
jgi:thioredoxin 1